MLKLSVQDLTYWRGRHGPSWRYLLASNFAGSSGPPRVADRLIVNVGRFLQLQRQGGESVAAAARTFPKIAEVFCLQEDKRLVDALRTMILGQLESAEIVTRTGLSSRTIRGWMAIFFDVDMAHDPLGWQINHIVYRELDAGNLQLAGRLHTARCLGPRAARRILDGPQPVSLNSEEYREMVRVQAEIESFGLLMSPALSRQEM